MHIIMYLHRFWLINTPYVLFTPPRAPHPSRADLPTRPKESHRFASIVPKKRKRWIQAPPSRRRWAVQSICFIICSVCVSAWACVCACASMWPVSGECVACSRAQGPDRERRPCMWWPTATRHNRTLQTEPNAGFVVLFLFVFFFSYLGTSASVAPGGFNSRITT